jgi:dethiobiotin synthetase
MNSPKIIFVTGTDTDVGKTFYSLDLIRKHLRKNSFARCLYIKPISCGVPSDQDEIKKKLGKWAARVEIKNCYSFVEPVSPHLAARWNQKKITAKALAVDIAFILYSCLTKKEDKKVAPSLVVIEGAGGVMAPINESETMLDVMKQLKLPITLVARAGLGTLNHTLLSFQRLEQNGLTVEQIVLNRHRIKVGLLNRQIIQENQRYLQKACRVPCSFF